VITLRGILGSVLSIFKKGDEEEDTYAQMKKEREKVVGEVDRHFKAKKEKHRKGQEK